MSAASVPDAVPTGEGGRLWCGWEVSRDGDAQPCDKTAVGMRYDQGEESPVCKYHAVGDMVPLADLLARARETARAEGAAEVWDEGYEAAYQMARSWGHVDSWEDEPTNPYRIARDTQGGSDADS